MTTHENKTYTAQYFKESLPEWKRKKDPVLTKIFYRPISFCFAAFFANRGVGANAVSYLSTIVALLACASYLTCSFAGGITGALLVNFWLILDCTDGNIARSVKAEPYGEFVDATSSYLLVGLLFNVLGLYAYRQGGRLFHDAVEIIFLGALASSFDSLMRLLYQKYIVVSRDWNEDGKIAQDGSNGGKIDKIRIRVEQEIGMGGILPFALALMTAFHAVDFVIIAWCAYYGSVFVATLLYLSWKAWRKGRPPSLSEQADL